MYQLSIKVSENSNLNKYLNNHKLAIIIRTLYTWRHCRSFRTGC